MRLFAVLILIPVTAYWGIFAIYLLALPEGAPGATLAVLVGAVFLVIGGLYALATWGTAKRKRGLHIFAIVMAALGVVGPILVSVGSFGVVAVVNAVVLTLLAVANAVALVLLALTIPRGVVKA